MWLQFAVSLFLAVVGQLLAPKPPKPQDASVLNPEGIPSVGDTEPVAVLFGTRELPKNNVVWYGDLKTVPIRSEESGGKK